MESLLILTNEKAFFEKNSHMIFLGDWCIKYTDKKLLTEYDYEIAPEIYYDFEENLKYIENFSDKLCECLGKELNRFDKGENTKEYWKFIMNHWIRSYLDEWYTAYLEIVSVLERYHDLRVKIIEEKKYPDIFNDNFHVESNRLGLKSYVIYSRIIHELKSKYNIKVEKWNGDEYKWVKLRDYKIHEYSKEKFLTVYKKTLGTNPPILCYNFPVTGRGIWLKLRQINKTFFLEKLPYNQEYTSKNMILRKQIIITDKLFNDFERMVAKNIVYDFPVEWMEQYYNIKKQCELNLPDYRPRVIIAPFITTGDRVFMSQWHEEGTQIRGMAHSLGGSVLRYDPYESDVDVYYSWGSFKKVNRRQCPTYKQVGLDKVKKFKIKDQILWCSSGIGYEYGHNICSYWFSSRSRKEKEEDLRNLVDFVGNLNSPIRKKILYRSRDIAEWGLADFFKERFFDFSVDDTIEKGKKAINISGFTERVLKSRLVICESLLTAVLGESLVYNKPTIIICRDDLKKNREELFDGVLDLFHKLKIQGIWYQDGKAAAAFLNDNYNDIESWWMEPNRQLVVKEFVDTLFLASENRNKWWNREFNAIVRNLKTNK